MDPELSVASALVGRTGSVLHFGLARGLSRSSLPIKIPRWREATVGRQVKSLPRGCFIQSSCSHPFFCQHSKSSLKQLLQMFPETSLYFSQSGIESFESHDSTWRSNLSGFHSDVPTGRTFHLGSHFLCSAITLAYSGF